MLQRRRLEKVAVAHTMHLRRRVTGIVLELELLRKFRENKRRVRSSQPLVLIRRWWSGFCNCTFDREARLCHVCKCVIYSDVYRMCRETTVFEPAGRVRFLGRIPKKHKGLHAVEFHSSTILGRYLLRYSEEADGWQRRRRTGRET
jgi:hypothetical protein